MVTAKTCGRLGNFLFQFAATYCHAMKNGFDYCMPSKSMNERLWPTPKFKNIKYGGPQPGKLYQEKSPAYSPIPDEDNLILEGYWQSEKYWHVLHNELARVLEFETGGRQDYAAIHIRRGDYLRFPEEFPVLPMEYYKSAIEFMRLQGQNYFKVYSDDIRWCQSAFDVKEFEDVVIHFSLERDPIEDLKDMYSCGSFIIANSSYSLFVALLKHNESIVVAPSERRWFGKNAQHLNSKDRIPERFIKM